MKIRTHGGDENNRMGWRRRLASLTAAALFLPLAAVVVSSAPAQANTFGPSGCCQYADNNVHTFANTNVGNSNILVALEYARNNLDLNTDMYSQFKGSADSYTDDVSFDADYTTYWGLTWDSSAFYGYGYIAYTRCVNTSGTAAGNCQRYDSRYDTPDMTAIGAAGRNHIACHEVGHSVGLGHSSGTASCLQNEPTGSTRYSDHDRTDHINSRW